MRIERGGCGPRKWSTRSSTTAENSRGPDQFLPLCRPPVRRGEMIHRGLPLLVGREVLELLLTTLCTTNSAAYRVRVHLGHGPSHVLDDVLRPAELVGQARQAGEHRSRLKLVRRLFEERPDGRFRVPHALPLVCPFGELVETGFLGQRQHIIKSVRLLARAGREEIVGVGLGGRHIL